MSNYSAIEMKALKKMDALIGLDPPTRTSTAIHLVATWFMAAALRFIFFRLVNTLEGFNQHLIVPHFAGVWWFGFFAQTLVTIIALTNHKPQMRYFIPFLYGFWLCALIAMADIYVPMFFSQGIKN